MDQSPKSATSSRPKVAVVYHFFPHYRAPIIERLARSSVADFVFFGDDHDYESATKGCHFSERVELRFCSTRKLFRSIMWQNGLLAIALTREFDQIIFHSNPYWLATWLGAIIARLRGKRVLYWGHGFLYPPRGLKGLLRRVFYRLAHTHLFYGRLAKTYAVAAGWDPRTIHVISNCLDLEAQTQARAEIANEDLAAFRATLFKDPSLPVAFCSCRLQVSKRLDLLIHALARLQKIGVRANLLIVGDGVCRDDLERLARESGIDAHFVGACYDETKLGRFISLSTVTVSPGFVGLTAIHSMTFGVPVITHDTFAKQAPEFEAIVPGITGDFFHMGDIDDLARVMRSWLEDRADRASTRAACIDVVERFWSPTYQQQAIEHAVLGYPAEGLPVPPNTSERSPGQ